MNLSNLELQGRRSDLVTCAQKIKGYVIIFINKKKNSFIKKLCHLKISTPLFQHQNILLHCLHVDYERRYKYLIKIDYPLWLIDLENLSNEINYNIIDNEMKTLSWLTCCWT